tara:strand:- start:560 stop:1279 length:720 start_codon:yes stop_codon:yes gene_type:complete
MQFKVYLLISLIIHLSTIFLFPEFEKKEIIKGEKFIPIEIINNEAYSSSKGNSNQNSADSQGNKIKDKKNKFIKKDNKINPKQESKLNEKEEIIKGDLRIKKKQIDKNKINKSKIKTLYKEKKLDNSKISTPQKKGFSNRDDNKDFEKGSIKGKGKLKITCLKCISPKYPRKALEKGLEGKPIVKVWILEDGSVEKAELIISSGITSIDKAALIAAKKSKFYPIEFKSFINIEYNLKIK